DRGLTGERPSEPPNRRSRKKDVTHPTPTSANGKARWHARPKAEECRETEETPASDERAAEPQVEAGGGPHGIYFRGGRVCSRPSNYLSCSRPSNYLSRAPRRLRARVCMRLTQDLLLPISAAITSIFSPPT